MTGPKTTHSDEADDERLFREAMGDVQPLKGPMKQVERPRPPPSRPLMREADEAAVIAALLDPPDWSIAETGEELIHRSAGVQDSVMRKLRRGQFSMQAVLDLHGMTIAQAKPAVVHFLDHARDRGLRAVRIIHGKGNRSGQRGPVLKASVAHWLRQRQEVLAYASARPVDGGSGAVYVLLRAI